MVVHGGCCTWIKLFWVELVSSFTQKQSPPIIVVHVDVPPLPDNIIFDILSRLPAEHVSVCRRVCKKWLELTSTTHFAHTHLQRQAAAPHHNDTNNNKLIFFQCSSKNYRHGFFIFNIAAKGKRMFKKMKLDIKSPAERPPILFGSCNGLLLFKPRSHYNRSRILNLTTQERINIMCHVGPVCGFFFHPSSKKYVLMYYKNNGVDGAVCDYFLFTLEVESFRKVATFPYYSSECPVFANGALHWIIDSKSNDRCGNSLMKFDVETEVFTSFPHPGKRCSTTTCNRGSMQLLEEITSTRHELCFSCMMYDYIDIWVSEDNNIWVKRYVVYVDWHWYVTDLRLLYIENGELLSFGKTKGLLAYNLEDKKVRKIDTSGMKVKGTLDSVISATCYVKSLVSLEVSRKYPNPAGKFPTFKLINID